MTDKRSWLEGPQVPGENEDPSNISAYPGENLGLPQEGPGSLAPLFPRMAALLLDWLLCWGIAFFITRMTDWWGDVATVTMMVFIVVRTLTVWLFAQTPGHAIVGIGVVRLDDHSRRVGFGRAFFRTVLTVFLFPPVIQDTDGRGMHDRATGTGVIRTR
ncbi:RDD family protein [Corynebacterium anserum]|uniref:RDD family protein n=1 Tax=Corynebacterium anserum TaxID=2684406 RepID=A0A7G7YMU5_9CORY|nr:RDD family protein [Corynebacterium anserum]MBC2681193.1 RDD family protein [Corynebacterium anserum]QNH95815.1 RDD family protein [Corynebacterium anserum]